MSALLSPRPRDEKQGTVDADTRLRIDIHLRNTAVAPHPLLAVALTALRNEHPPLLAAPPPPASPGCAVRPAPAPGQRTWVSTLAVASSITITRALLPSRRRLRRAPPSPLRPWPSV